MTFDEAKRECDQRNKNVPGSAFPPAQCPVCQEWYVFEDGHKCEAVTNGPVN